MNEEQLKKLHQDLHEVRKLQADMDEKIKDISSRLLSVEQPMGNEDLKTPVRVVTSPVTSSGVTEAPKEPPKETPANMMIKKTIQPAKRKVKAPEAHKKNEYDDLENIIGGTWLNRIGVIAFIIGMAFFIKHASDQGWITESGRLIIGGITSLLLLSIGEKIRRTGLTLYSQGLTGGGIILLYFCTYAAFNLYMLIQVPVAYILMVCITVLAVTLSVYQNAIVIALLGLMGGYLTPFMFSEGGDSRMIPLLVYILILNGGIVSLYLLKKWKFLGITSVLPTGIIILIILSLGSNFFLDYNLWIMQLFATILLLIVSLTYPFIKVFFFEEAMEQIDYLTLVSGASFYYLAGCLTLYADYSEYMGIFTLLLGLLYAFVGVIFFRHKEDDDEDDGFMLFFAKTIILAVLFIIVQFREEHLQHYIILGWSIQAVVLAYIAARINDSRIKTGFWIIFTLAALALIGLEWLVSPEYTKYIFLLNRPALYTYVVAAAAGISLLFFNKYEVEYERNEEEQNSDSLFVLAGVGSALFFIFVTIDIYRYGQFIIHQTGGDPQYYTNLALLGMSVFWGLFATALLVSGFLIKMHHVRYTAIGLYAITILKVFLIDLGSLDIAFRIVSLIVLGLILLAVSYIYQRSARSE